MRIAWDEIWMGLASNLAKRSTCARLKVGCVIVSSTNDRVLAVGYNGGGRNRENACDSNEPGQCGCLHAEENCLIKCDFRDPATKILYTTVSPCLMCSKRCVNGGIHEVVYQIEYRKTEGIQYLLDSGINVRKL